MSEGKHTLLPWRVVLGRSVTASLRDANGYGFATIDDGENAAFIVKAVNSHDQLVEALSRLLYDHPANLTDRKPPFIEQAREALKAAGEEV